MIELKNLNLTEVFGQKKIEKWEKKYPIFRNNDVKLWIVHKVEKYARSGKIPSRFNTTGYLKPLNDYCRFYECENPTEFLEEEIDERNKRLLTYLSSLLRDGVNEGSVKNMIQSRIKSFYSDRGSPLSDGLQTVSAGSNVNEIILDRNTIQKILVNLHRPEYRLILKFQALTGFRISDILECTPKYKIEKYKNHSFIRNFKTMKEGVKINYVFFPTELSNLIESVGGFIFETKMGNKINKNNYLRRLKAICKEMGIEGNIKTHTFRKYFSSQVRRSREIDAEFREHLLGHKATNLSRSYNQNLLDIEWFYKQWLKIEPNICIDCEVYDRTSEEVKKLKQENFELRGDISNMKKEFSLMKEMVNTFFPMIDKDKFEKYIEKQKKEGKVIKPSD
ncbi:MAG: tyrosine-type recombinase/integrase [Promethearchaeota archaeon]